ncbi:pyrimidine/purine nucleoside phosphorylase [Acidobacteriota bacterium]
MPIIKSNEYFEGRIKSLGFELNGDPYTVGVMLPGEYSIGTEKEEQITVTLGELEICPQDSNWRSVKAGETITVPANTTFALKIRDTVAYLCKYV